MSNEPKRLSALPSEAAAAAERDADAARMAAAFERMEAAVRGKPDSIDRLRTELAELADAVAQARIAADAAARLRGDVDALLQDIAARTQRMIALTGPAPETTDEQAFLDAMRDAGAERVPTVSGVVSQLGRENDATVIEPAAGAGNVTTVSMLEAMVEELAASMPAAKPAATEAAAPRDPAAPGAELLSSFARMEAMPFLPPEVGTAVIFEAKTKPGTTAAEPEPAEPEPAEPTPVEPTPVEPAALHDPILVMPHVAPPAEAQTEAGDIDLDSLLFEPPPEPEPDPAAFLLEPTPWPAEPQPALATEPAEASPTQRTIETAVRPQPSWTVDLPGPVAVAAPDRPAPAAVIDPLGPLKAMSDEEKIALFE